MIGFVSMAPAAPDPTHVLPESAAITSPAWYPIKVLSLPVTSFPASWPKIVFDAPAATVAPAPYPTMLFPAPVASRPAL